jgi:hypothetical protein
VPYPTSTYTSGISAFADLVTTSIAKGFTPDVSLGQIEVLAAIVRQLLTTSPALKVYSLSLSPVSVAANTCAEQILAVANITTAEKIVVIVKPTSQAGLALSGSARVSSAGNVAMNFVNDTAAPIVPTAAETYTIVTIIP